MKNRYTLKNISFKRCTVITYVESILQKALQSLNIIYPEKVVIEPPKNKDFGDVATNIAMLLAKECKKNPRSIAEDILPYIKECDDIQSVEIAGAGFINISFTKEYWHRCFIALEKNALFTPRNHEEKVLIEFVSANPTGPLHVGHARGAVFGDTLRRIFEFAGYSVDTEYYINDAGNQMHMLGLSVYLRLRELKNLAVTFPDEYYKGDYIIDIAKALDTENPSLSSMDEEEALRLCRQYATKAILSSIKTDLQDFRVEHSHWFHESSLVDSHVVEKTLQLLRDKGFVYEKEGALWFESTRFGDDKDRVVKKQDNSYTYFASDIAYHANKIERGYSILFDILGADHHGYVQRLQSAVKALAISPVELNIPLIQLVSLLRDGKPLSMSTRAGTFETLRELIQEVGVDAARFMFLSRRNDSPLEFDLDIVSKKTMDNPVYYVQYANARIHSLCKRYELEIAKDVLNEDCIEDILSQPEEIALIQFLMTFPDYIDDAVRFANPNILTQYLTLVAETFHRYYARYQLCSASNPNLSCMRLRLCRKVQEAIQVGLSLLGVSAPKEM